MPARDCMPVQVLTALEFGGEDKREKSSRLLHHILLASQKLIRPYVTEVLQAVLPALQDANPNVAANVITVVGVLSTVGSAQVVVKQDAIFPLMIEAIQDLSSTTKRRVATSTLALMVQRTGTVIEPYKRYPDLLGVLLKGLQVEQVPVIRLELLTVLGVLGAIDPHTVKKLDLAKHKRLGSASLLGGAGGEGGGGRAGKGDGAHEGEGLPGPSTEEYYDTVAVTTLIKILKEPSLSSYHQMVIQAVMFIFRTLGLKCVKLLPQVMSLILHLLRGAQHGLRDFLFQQLALLVSIIKQYIRPYLDQVFQAVHEFWEHEALQPQMLFLIGEIAAALRDEFKRYIPALIPRMLAVLSRDGAQRRTGTCIKVLLAWERL